jgi:hypothetical protein
VGEPLPAGLVEPKPEYIPAGSGDQSVSLDLASIGATLQPGTTYHYKVIASNYSGPTVEGPDQTFTTPEDTVQPLSTNTTTSTSSGAGQPAGINTNSGNQPTGSGGSPAPGVTPLGRQIVCLCNCTRGCHGKKVGPNHLTQTQKLSKALKACAKKPKSKSTACELQARSIPRISRGFWAIGWVDMDQARLRR